MAEYHSIPIINWGLLLGIILGGREENWGSFSGSVSCQGRFRDHFRGLYRRQDAKLYKFRLNVFPNISHTKLAMLIFFHFPDYGRSVSNGFHFFFRWHDSENGDRDDRTAVNAKGVQSRTVIQGLYAFLDSKFKDFSRTFQDIFSIFQGLHELQNKRMFSFS